MKQLFCAFICCAFLFTAQAQTYVWQGKTYKIFPYRMQPRHNDYPWNYPPLSEVRYGYMSPHQFDVPFLIPEYTGTLEDGDYIVFYDTTHIRLQENFKYCSHKNDIPNAYHFNPAATFVLKQNQKNGPTFFYDMEYRTDLSKEPAYYGLYKNDLKQGKWVKKNWGEFGFLVDSFWCHYDSGVLNGTWGKYSTSRGLHANGTLVNNKYLGENNFEFINLFFIDFDSVRQLKSTINYPIQLNQKQYLLSVNFVKTTTIDASQSAFEQGFEWDTAWIFDYNDKPLYRFLRSNHKDNFSYKILPKDLLGNFLPLVQTGISMLPGNMEEIIQVERFDSLNQQYRRLFYTNSYRYIHIRQSDTFQLSTGADIPLFQSVRASKRNSAKPLHILKHNCIVTYNANIFGRNDLVEVVETADGVSISRELYRINPMASHCVPVYQWLAGNKLSGIQESELKTLEQWQNTKAQLSEQTGHWEYSEFWFDSIVHDNSKTQLISMTVTKRPNSNSPDTNKIERVRLGPYQVQHYFNSTTNFEWPILNFLGDSIISATGFYNTGLDNIRFELRNTLNQNQISHMAGHNRSFLTSSPFNFMPQEARWYFDGEIPDCTALENPSELLVNGKPFTGELLVVEIEKGNKKRTVAYIENSEKSYNTIWIYLNNQEYPIKAYYNEGNLIQFIYNNLVYSRSQDLKNWTISNGNSYYIENGNPHGVWSDGSLSAVLQHGIANGPFISEYISGYFKQDTLVQCLMTWAQHKVADSIPLNEKGQANGLVKLSELNDEASYIPFENGVFNGKAMRYTAANILAETCESVDTLKRRSIYWNVAEKRLVDGNYRGGQSVSLMFWVTDQFKLSIQDNFNELLSHGISNMDGLHTWFYPNGIASAKGMLKAGIRIGDWEYYSESGKLYKRIHYQPIPMVVANAGDSIANTFRVEGFDRNGRALFAGYVLKEDFDTYCASDVSVAKDFVYYTEVFDSTGNNLLNGKTMVEVMEYNQTGNLVYRGFTRNGRADCLWEFYNLNGTLNAIGMFRNGKKNGRWLYGSLSGWNYDDNICFNAEDSVKIASLRNQLTFTEELWKNGDLISTASAEYSRVGATTEYRGTLLNMFYIPLQVYKTKYRQFISKNGYPSVSTQTPKRKKRFPPPNRSF